MEQGQFLVNDIWKETASDIRRIDIKIDKVLPLRIVQQVCDILTKTTYDRKFQARISALEQSYYDELQHELAHTKDVNGLSLCETLTFVRPTLDGENKVVEHLRPESTLSQPLPKKEAAYSFWKQFDLSLMLSDDPEAEAEILA